MDTTTYPRLNIYLDNPNLRAQIKIAAARQGLTLSAYCLEAIRHRLAEDGLLQEPIEPAQQPPAQLAARALDDLRRRIGPIGVPVHELIAEGRRR